MGLESQIGNNTLVIRAKDAAGNSGHNQVVVERTIGLAPTLYLISPEDNSIITVDKINVQGVVYSLQAPEQIRIRLGVREQFAQTGPLPGVYPFSFDNVPLTEGGNTFTVLVESPVANDQKTLNLTYQTISPEEVAKPTITLTSPGINRVTKESSMVVAGRVTWSTGVSDVSVNGQSATLTGADNTDVNFETNLDLSTITGETTLTITMTNTLTSTATESLVIVRDPDAPVISLTTPNLSSPPTVNSVRELPFTLDGTVSDATLAAFSVNDTPINLIPSPDPDTYNFRIALNLPVQTDQLITLVARDHAGQQTSVDYVFNADIPVTVEMISPKDGDEIQISGPTPVIDAAVRLTGLLPGMTVNAHVDQGIAQPMTLDGIAATVALLMPTTDGAHTITVEVLDDTNTVVSSRNIEISLINLDTIPLEVTRIEPQNNQSGIEPNAFIAVYFNKPIELAQTQISIRETAHGLTYDLSAQNAKSPLMHGNTAALIEVLRDAVAVPAGVSEFPGKQMLAYYPERDFAYGAQVYVDVTYATQVVSRTQFKVRTLPTFIQGFAVDQTRQPAANIEITLPDSGRSTTTDKEGNYTFGFGDAADTPLPPGRQRIVFNPGRKNPQYQEIESIINVEQGRLTEIGVTYVPLINTLDGGRCQVRQETIYWSYAKTSTTRCPGNITSCYGAGH